MNDHPETFPVRLGDLPSDLSEGVRAELRHFAVPLMLNDDFIGSGVLVQIDNVFGILTAEHVVNNNRSPFDNSLDSRQVLVTSVSERANAVCIEMRHLTWWTTPRQTDEWGPDLAFIRLPAAAGFTRQLRTSKSFYNLTLDSENRLKEALDNTGFMAFVGYVAEQITDAPPESGFPDVRRIQGYAFLTGPEKYHVQNGFDYVDVGCNRVLCPTMPKSFGGVSGSGLWRFDTQELTNRPDAKAKLFRSLRGECLHHVGAQQKWAPMTGKKGKSGGAREGSGRKATGRTKQMATFYISPEILSELEEHVPAGERSQFVEDAIARNLRSRRQH